MPVLWEARGGMEVSLAKTLTRDTERAVLAGVAAGFARYFDVDPVVARLAFVVLAFLHGVGVIVYAICWVILPKEGEGAGEPAASSSGEGRGGGGADEGGTDAGVAAGAPGEAAPPVTPMDRFVGEVRTTGERVVEKIRTTERDRGRGQVVAGSILLGIGLLFLASRLDLWFWPRWLSFRDLWPLILIAIGLSMILRPKAGPS